MKRLRRLNRILGYFSLCGAPLATAAVMASACGDPFSSCEAHRSCPTDAGSGGEGENPDERGGTAGTGGSGTSSKGGAGTTAGGSGAHVGGAAGDPGVPGDAGAGGRGDDCAPGSKVCDDGSCVPEDGCCVESDCASACQACSEGSCVAVQGAEDADSCDGTCDNNGDCKSAQGQQCQTGNGCVAGTVCSPDGVCCDSACTNSCEACDVNGFEGTCTPVASGKPHGNRAACEGDDASCAGSCTGREDGQCTFPTRACGTENPCSGTKVVGQSACEEGSCVAPEAAICDGGFVCAASACKTSCASDAECDSSYFCTEGTCHPDAKQVTAGASHTCVLLMDGSVRCWGSNQQGAIGLPTGTPRSPSPVTVSGLPNGVTAISAGNTHTCALLNGGSIHCWGNNSSGQLGNGTKTSTSTPVAVAQLFNAAQISATGGNHACATLTDGTVWCWGANGNGQLGVSMTTQDSAKPIRAGALTSVVHVATGSTGTCAIKADGTVWCWGGGSGTPIQVNYISTGAALALSQAVNYRHTCALLSGGSIRCWGSNNNGQLGNGTKAESADPIEVTGIRAGATSITVGGVFSCASISDGTARCWGSNGGGQLGNGGTAMDYPEPVTVTGLSTVTQLAAGGLHVCAILKNGSLRCWGNNLDGQLGTGTSNDSSLPVATSGW